MPRTFFENKELKLKRIDNIINVSLRLFAAYGYKKVTIDMITKECRYSHGLFYHYFSSKSEVLREIRKRSNALFSEKFLAISKTSSLGYDFLRSSLCTIVDFINNGGEENYYVHLLFSTKLSELNDGVKMVHFNKEVFNLFSESIKIVRSEFDEFIKKENFKRYLILFLTVIDGLSSSKINYPNLYKKNIDGNVFFDRLVAFLKGKTPLHQNSIN